MGYRVLKSENSSKFTLYLPISTKAKIKGL